MCLSKTFQPSTAYNLVSIILRSFVPPHSISLLLLYIWCILFCVISGFKSKMHKGRSVWNMHFGICNCKISSHYDIGWFPWVSSVRYRCWNMKPGTTNMHATVHYCNAWGSEMCNKLVKQTGKGPFKHIRVGYLGGICRYQNSAYHYCW